MSDAPSEVVEIHTSDRILFKKCRRQWHYRSPLRLAYRPVEVARPLNFGTAIHHALEVYYNPATWRADRTTVRALSIASFVDTMKQAKREYLRNARREALDELQQREYDEDLKLGVGMLQNYFHWAARNDRFVPVAVELDFAVPIPGLPLDKSGNQVVYAGRIDLVVRDEHGDLWIVDHKTTARWDDRSAFLELDEQMGSYAWAAQQILGEPIRGCIYSELYKGAPEPPQLLSRPYKGRILSTNAQQNTTYDLMIAAIDQYERGNRELYRDYLNFLREGGKTYFRRFQVHRSQKELENLGIQIGKEAREMLREDLPIYPNPNRFTCDWCSYRPVCLAENDGSDWMWQLNNNYIPGNTYTTRELEQLRDTVS